MNVKIINKSNNPLPSYKTNMSAGMDLHAFIQGPVVIKPFQRLLISTGLSLELPPGTEAQIRPRSGFALKQGVTVLNTPGTIDADYRGEVGVVLINLSSENVTITSGDRIAQMVFAKYEQASLELAHELSDSERGIGGFGSTGK